MKYCGAGPRGWPVVFAAGIYGSASTWVYNAIRLLFEQIPTLCPVHAGFADALAEFPEPLISPGSMVIKTHQPDNAMLLFARATSALVVLTVRDPRDAVASMVQRFNQQADDSVPSMVMCAKRLALLAAMTRVLVLRYEDASNRSAETVQRIASFLDLVVAPTSVSAIADSLMPDKVAADIAGMVKRGILGETPDISASDAVTQWHAGHLGDGRTGKWKEVLSERQAEKLIASLRSFCETYGYPY